MRDELPPALRVLPVNFAASTVSRNSLSRAGKGGGSGALPQEAGAATRHRLVLCWLFVDDVSSRFYLSPATEVRHHFRMPVQHHHTQQA